MTELANWLTKTDKFSETNRAYAWNNVGKSDELTWWEAWFPDTNLSKVVKAIYTVPLSAAATERNWSIRGAIHTKSRNRLKVATASQLTYIKHNTLIQNADLFKKRRGKIYSSSSESAIEEDDIINIDDEVFDAEIISNQIQECFENIEKLTENIEKEFDDEAESEF